MSVLQDLLAALDRIELWRRLKPLPDRVAQLEARVAELERRAGRQPAANACPMCGSEAFMRISSRPHPEWGPVAGFLLDTWQCPSCNHSEDRERDPNASVR